MEPDHPDDTIPPTLLARLRKGEKPAQAAVDALFGELVFCVLESLNVEDVVAETGKVFEKVFAKIGSFSREKPGSSFRKWLSQIAWNHGIDCRRKMGSPGQVHLDTDGLQQLPDSTGEDSDSQQASHSRRDRVLKNEVHRMVDMIRGDFEPATMQCFERLWFQGETVKATASALGMSEGAVRDARYRVLKRLKEAFYEFYGSEEWPFRDDWPGWWDGES